MEYRDYYKILGVEKNASPEQIKKQYRRLARKYHPDVSKEANAEEKFKEVQEAYEVLKDPEKRKTFDQFSEQPSGWDAAARRHAHAHAEPRGQRFYSEDDLSGAGFSEFFESLFGQRFQSRPHGQRSQRGQDLHSKIKLTVEEAFSGTQRRLQLQEPELDPSTGEVKLKTRSLNVKIPSGVIAGQQIRLAHQGNPGMGGAPRGDLFLEIELLEHPFYIVKDRDIYLNLPVTPWEAALGAKIPAPTLAGTVELTIPAGSQTGKKLRLKARGFPGSPPGDQYVLIHIYIPVPKTESQRQIYKKMAEEMSFNPRLELGKEA